MAERTIDEAGRALCEVCFRPFIPPVLVPGAFAHLWCLHPGSSGAADLIPVPVTERDLDAVVGRRQRAGLPALPDVDLSPEPTDGR